MLEIKKVAVLGTGVMGSQIAAHLANAGIPSYNFDLNSETAQKGFDFALNVKPAAFFTKRNAKLITLCTYDDDLKKISECDWVIEVIGEKLEWKHDLFKKIEPHLKETAILTSNTSSFKISDLSKNFSSSLKKRFFISHFFNPPRYLKLLELIKSDETDQKIYEEFARFGEDKLGKNIVYGKSTPGFVANRIGVYGIMLTMELQQKYKIPINMIDKLTGTLIGRPKSATFRTSDVVGLDTMVNVANSLYENCIDDSERNIFQIPDFLKKMLEKDYLGQKTKKGFFYLDKKTKEIFEINFETLEYEPVKKVKYDAFKVAKDQTDMERRLHALSRCDDLAGEFMTELMVKSLMYAAHRVPEIADDIIQIDNALMSGFGWNIGVFETLDMIGVQYAANKYKEYGKKIPLIVEKLLSKGYDKFYKIKDGKRYFFDLKSSEYLAEELDERIIKLDYIKQAKGVIEKNWCASLIDIGDGVACLQFHSILQSEMNPVDGSILDMLKRAPKLVEREGFKGMVLGHQGAHFSAGANLSMILELSKMKLWNFVEKITNDFQAVNQGMRFAPFPVVSAPFSLALGGGYEMISAADKVIASAETYMGLVEVGVGVIPGGGGCLRLLMNFQDLLNPQSAGWGKRSSGPFPVAQKAFETIGFAKISTSAQEAFDLGYLRPHDEIIMNQAQQIAKAKAEVLKLADGYKTPELREDLHLTGESGRLVFEQSIEEFVRKATISEYDAFVAKKLANILTGGNRTNGINRLNENDVLELEKEAFVSLCGEQKTQDRMAYMLKTGKPLRN
jgi:3-hydroxyacyl-CoA dehydrogenase